MKNASRATACSRWSSSSCWSWSASGRFSLTIKLMNIKLVIPTAEGVFTAHYSQHGLAQLDFPTAKSAAATNKESSAPAAQIRGWHRLTTRALNEALAGRAPRVLPPLDLSSGTEFQRRVW